MRARRNPPRNARSPRRRRWLPDVRRPDARNRERLLARARADLVKGMLCRPLGHREILHLRRQRRGERDRDLQPSALAAHRPVAAQRVLDVIERRRRGAHPHLRSKPLELGTSPFGHSRRGRVIGGNPGGQRIVPVDDQTRHGVTGAHQRGRRLCQRAAGARRSAPARSSASSTAFDHRCSAGCQMR